MSLPGGTLEYTPLPRQGQDMGTPPVGKQVHPQHRGRYASRLRRRTFLFSIVLVQFHVPVPFQCNVNKSLHLPFATFQASSRTPCGRKRTPRHSPAAPRVPVDCTGDSCLGLVTCHCGNHPSLRIDQSV